MSGALVAVNGTRLYCERAGAGPPLVMIHGDALDARLWDDPFDFFSRHYSVLRYDVRGFGRSDPPAGPYADIDDLQALLRHSGWGRAHIMGLSMGGRIAVDFALAHPAAVRSLVLIDSGLGGYPWSDAVRQFFAELFGAARGRGVEAARALWLDAPGHGTVRAHPRADARFRRMVADYSGWFWLNEDPGRELEPPAYRRLEDVLAPTLVLVGARDNADCRAIADQLHRRIPGARKEELAGVGHLSVLEAPGRVGELAAGFLAGVAGDEFADSP